MGRAAPIAGLLAPWAVARPRCRRCSCAPTALAVTAGSRPPLSLVSLGAARRAIWMTVRRSPRGASGGPRRSVPRRRAVGADRGVRRRWSPALAMLPGQASRDEDGRARAPRIPHLTRSLFILSMLVAVTINNVALMWVAIEATDDHVGAAHPPAPLEGLGGSVVEVHPDRLGRASPWPSPGTVLAYFDFVTAARPAAGRAELAAADERRAVAASGRHAPGVRVPRSSATARRPVSRPCIPGCPTRTRRRQPPLSAMMSGVLLAVAQYAIIRWKAVVDRAAGPVFTTEVLDGPGAALGGGRGAEPGATAQLQTPAGVLERRAQRPHLPRARLRPGRRLRVDAARAESRAGQVDELSHGGTRAAALRLGGDGRRLGPAEDDARHRRGYSQPGSSP